MMKLTVGMPVHGALHAFEQSYVALRKVLKAIDARARIVVVDDHSEADDTRQLRRMVRNYPDTVVLHTRTACTTSNPNLALALNMALDMVDEDDEFYLNLESDIIMNDMTLVRLSAALDDNKHAVASFPAMRDTQGKYDFVFWGQREAVTSLPPDLAQTRKVAWSHLGCLLVKAEHARNRAIRADEWYKLWCVDGDYTCRLREQTGGDLMIVPRAEVVHLGRQSSREGQGLYDHLLSEAVQRFDATWGHLNRPLLLPQ